MQTIILLVLLFLIVIFSVLLYFNNKKQRQTKLDMGICPNCGAQAKTFTDESTGTNFKVDVINVRILKAHGCSGVLEKEYRCNSCDLKEIHSTIGQGCMI
jgi:ssDNA-binding Zn-finger/Zn-ribbon topoisomerase 1